MIPSDLWRARGRRTDTWVTWSCLDKGLRSGGAWCAVCVVFARPTVWDGRCGNTGDDTLKIRLGLFLVLLNRVQREKVRSSACLVEGFKWPFRSIGENFRHPIPIWVTLIKFLIGCWRRRTPSHTPSSICIALPATLRGCHCIFTWVSNSFSLRLRPCKFEQEFWLGWLPGEDFLDGLGDQPQADFIWQWYYLKTL